MAVPAKRICLVLRQIDIVTLGTVLDSVNYHPDNNVVEKEVEMQGYLNCHFCINAQTQMEHTEPDASYMVIMVPSKIVNEQGEKCSHKGRFDFIINKSSTLVVPVNPGLSMTYSGYMLTHRQQLRLETESLVPFINLVSYNSKRLFSNLMESFRRVIRMDKKTIFQEKAILNNNLIKKKISIYFNSLNSYNVVLLLFNFMTYLAYS